MSGDRPPVLLVEVKPESWSGADRSVLRWLYDLGFTPCRITSQGVAARPVSIGTLVDAPGTFKLAVLPPDSPPADCPREPSLSNRPGAFESAHDRENR